VRVTTGERLQRAITRKFGKEAKQVKVAEALGVPPGNLSEWLNDKYEPGLASLRHLAEGLDCSVASLIGDEEAA
jgi:transcriptional regulator with XRE-family HTH domain